MKSKDNIIVSIREKEDALKYEIWMFRETCKRIAHLSFDVLGQVEKNLLLESLAIHARILVDFFYQDRIHSDDIIAQDLLSEDKKWKDIRPELTQTLEEAKYKANKQLAHLSIQRIELEREGKKAWDYIRILKDIENVIKKFEEVKGKS